MDALILPGGESTAMRKLLDELQMFKSLKKRIVDGLPTLAVCAGLILLAKDNIGGPTHLGVLDIQVERNAYGRQTASFKATGELKEQPIPMTFIRAPKIVSYGNQVEPLLFYGKDVVGVRSKEILAMTFHPELDHSNAIYHYFIKMIRNKKGD